MENTKKEKKLSSNITLPESFIKSYGEKIIKPLFNGQCVSSVFAVAGGKRTIIKYILQNFNKFFENVSSCGKKKYIFIFTDFDELTEFSNINYLELIKKKLYSKINEFKIDIKSINNLNTIEEPTIFIKKVLEFLTSTNWYTFFIFNDFELTLSLSSSIYFNLESFLSINKSKIEYLFLTNLNLLDYEVISRFHNLKYALTRNIIFFPLLEKEVAFYLIDKIAKEQLNVKISETIKGLLYEICGGHPQLLKYSLYHLKNDGILDDKKNKDEKKINESIFSHLQLKTTCFDIWNSFGKKEKEVMLLVLKKEKIDENKYKEALDYLTKLNLIKKKNNNFVIFGRIFEKFLLNIYSKGKLFYDEINNKIFYNDKSCEEIFTYQEFKVLTKFLQHQNELLTRDDVAKAMWGSLYYQEKYSDWAIDKLISILRKKLALIGFSPEKLQTLKKRGFVLKNE